MAALWRRLLPHTGVVGLGHGREHLAIIAGACPVSIADKTVRPKLRHLQVKLIILGEISIIEVDPGREARVGYLIVCLCSPDFFS